MERASSTEGRGLNGKLELTSVSGRLKGSRVSMHSMNERLEGFPHVQNASWREA